MSSSTQFDAIGFAGGGNRCYWQSGFWEAFAGRHPQRPEYYVTVSAGAYHCAMNLAGKARQVREAYPACVSVFILPPSREELERRLRARAADSAVTIARRLAESREEILHVDDFDYVIVNDDFGVALADLGAIVTARRLRREAQAERHAALIADLLKPA